MARSCVLPLVVSLIAAALALALLLVPGDASALLRPLLVGVALLFGGFAVAARLQPFPAHAPDRLPAAGFVAVAALAPLVGSFALDNAWDSLVFLLRLLTAVAVVGAALIALAPPARRLALSLLVVYHFGGLLTAVQFAPVMNGEPPWLAAQLWHRVYRPYLQTLNLTCSYRFFAPEPDATSELWLRVEYAGGGSRWVTFPRREDATSGLAHHRHQKIVESAGRCYGEPAAAWVGLETLAQRRLEAGMKHVPPIPVPDIEPSYQYKETLPRGRLLFGSLARHVVRRHPDPDDPKRPIVGVKIYRASHRLVKPDEFLDGVDLLDPTTYHAYYQGEYDADGRLKPTSWRLEVESSTQSLAMHQDPFLYWLVPIVRDGEGRAPVHARGPVRNYVVLHAGDAKKLTTETQRHREEEKREK